MTEKIVMVIRWKARTNTVFNQVNVDGSHSETRKDEDEDEQIVFGERRFSCGRRWWSVGVRFASRGSQSSLSEILVEGVDSWRAPMDGQTNPNQMMEKKKSPKPKPQTPKLTRCTMMMVYRDTPVQYRYS
jgi:hypothetical protein